MIGEMGLRLIVHGWGGRPEERPPAPPPLVTDALLDRLIARVLSTSGGTGSSPRSTPVRSSSTLPQSTPEDIATAFAPAREAQRSGRPAAQGTARGLQAVPREAAAAAQHHHGEAVDLIQAESGKARRMAFDETCDVPMVTSHYLKRAAKLLAPVKRGGPVPVVSTSTEIRQPKGVVGVIAPWNFPRHGPLRRHPGAEDGRQRGRAQAGRLDRALTAVRRLAALRSRSAGGALPGRVRRGPDVGPTLIDNANYVMFTGSTATGRFIGQRAGQNLIGCLPRGSAARTR